MVTDKKLVKNVPNYFIRKLLQSTVFKHSVSHAQLVFLRRICMCVYVRVHIYLYVFMCAYLHVYVFTIERERRKITAGA